MMKMIIILTNKDDVTADFIIRELSNQNQPYYRLNTEDIPDKVKVVFSFEKKSFILIDTIKKIQIDLKEISSVYFRRAKVSDLSGIREINSQERNYLRGELAYLLEGLYKILEDRFWVNNVYRIREAENKIYQLIMAQEVGFRVPKSLISNVPGTLISAVNKKNGDCIIKPIKTGNIDSKTASRIVFTSKIKNDFFADEERMSSFPIYLQENIHKQYDLRCIVIGNHVYCAQIESQCEEDAKIDWRQSKKYLKHSIHRLPVDVEQKCIEITRRLRLRYSAIDLILDENGNYVFLECNPNGQWAWLEIRLGFPISKDIVRMLVEGDD